MFKYSVFIFGALFCIYLSGISCTEIDELVSVRCINCLCQAASSCDSRNYCKNGLCGPFRISRNYWIQAGKPYTIEGKFKNDTTQFEICANDTYCTFFVIQRYMKKHQKDCNGDGKVDCEDFMAIHKLGPDSCNKTLPNAYKSRFEFCDGYIDIDTA